MSSSVYISLVLRLSLCYQYTMHTCTTEDLLLYLYDDMPAGERTNTFVMLQQNWGLREKLQVLKEAKERLDNAPLTAPQEHSLQRVLDHLYHTNPQEITTATPGYTTFRS